MIRELTDSAKSRKSSLKGFLWLIVALALAVTVFWLSQRTAKQELPQLPKIMLEQLDGTQIILSDLKGKPAVINLWASWCAPCRRELPLLMGSAATNPDVMFIFASQQESREKVNAYLDDKGLILEHVLLDKKGRLADLFQSRALPTTLFFHSSGELSDAYLGELTQVSLFNALNALE